MDFSSLNNKQSVRVPLPHKMLCLDITVSVFKDEETEIQLN